MQDALPAALLPVSHIISLVGDTWGMILLGGIAWWLRGRTAGHDVITAVALSTLLWFALNGVFDVARPDPAAGIAVHDELDIGSFPSGHVQQTTAAVGTMFAHGIIGALGAAAVVLLVAVSRLHLGAHFIADVAVAVPLGACVAVIVQRWGADMRRRFSETRWLWPAIAGICVVALVLVPVAGLGDELRRWEATGLILGGLVALPAERHWVRYRGRCSMPAAAAGAFVVIGMAALNDFAGLRGSPAGGALLAFTVVWAWTIFPAILQRRDARR